MKFIVNQIDLSSAAYSVSKACAVKTVKPILECIKMEAKNDSLILTAYDGEISIEQKIYADVLEEGDACVSGKFFADFIGKIDEMNVIIETDENGMKINYGESKTRIQSLPATDFPFIGGVERKEYIEIKEKDLKKVIEKTVFCAATDESRPILKGCLLEVKDGVLQTTALDGFRMAVSEVEASSSSQTKIVCPARTLTEITRMLDGGDDTVKLYVEKNTLSVQVKETVLTSRLYLGEFVRKENIFPQEFTTTVTVQKSVLIESVERASVLIRGDKNNLVVFDIKSNKITLNANSEIGNVSEQIDADVSGEELKIAMNAKYLLDALKALTENVAVLSFNSSISPFTIENLEDKNSAYLVLPVRMGA